MGILYISIIKDVVNVQEPHRGTRIEVAPMSENLADTMDLAQGSNLAAR